MPHETIRDEFWIKAYSSYFRGKKIILGVTGSIAAVKSYDIARALVALKAEVRVILTENGAQFVTPLSFETLTNASCYTSMWENTHGTKHIDLARWADLVLVAPATANFIAKLTHGIADDLLSTELLASTVPICIAPAMNPAMWANPATQSNVEVLKNRGIIFFGPVTGLTACGEEGSGRMMEVADIIENLSTKCVHSNAKKNVVINLGPTRSYLDPVRYLTNRSSGKMGAALAFALSQRGYSVHVITGPTLVSLPKLARVTRVNSSQEMAQACKAAFLKADAFFATAAVLDFEFPSTSTEKEKKSRSTKNIPVRATEDILYKLGQEKSKRQILFGFAAETQQHLMHAAEKLKKKNCDYVFVNPVEGKNSVFESNEGRGWLISKSETPLEFKSKNKIDLAFDLLDRIGF